MRRPVFYSRWTTGGVDVGSVDRGRFILPYSPRAVIDTAWSGESFSTRVWGNTEELAKRIRGEAQEMVMGLKSPATVKRQLMKDHDVSFAQASRLVDTELSYVLNKANLEEYRRRGIKKLTITNLDVGTCDKCKALEGEVFFTEDVPVLPIHPRCHCGYCRPDDLDAAEVTASGEDLDAVYARKGVKGYGDEGAPKTYTPKAQRAAEVARENGLIPASELQAKVERAMAEASPELAENIPEPPAGDATTANNATDLHVTVTDGIIAPATMKDGADVRVIGEINPVCLAAAFGTLNTLATVVTDERIDHIQTHHPQDYELFREHGQHTIEAPDIVLLDEKNDRTVFMIAKLTDTNLNTIVRLSVAGTDNAKLKNSVMTFYRLRDKNLKKLIKKHKVLYMRTEK